MTDAETKFAIVAIQNPDASKLVIESSFYDGEVMAEALPRVRFDDDSAIETVLDWVRKTFGVEGAIIHAIKVDSRFTFATVTLDSIPDSIELDESVYELTSWAEAVKKIMANDDSDELRLLELLELDKHLSTDNDYPTSGLFDVDAIKDGDAKTILFQIGGYYAHYVAEVYEVFKILEVDAQTLHMQVYGKSFDHLPDADEVQNLAPTMHHIPMGIGALFMFGFEYICASLSDREVFYGFDTYLDSTGVEEDERLHRVENLVEMSQQKPADVRFIYSDGIVRHTIISA